MGLTASQFWTLFVTMLGVIVISFSSTMNSRVWISSRAVANRSTLPHPFADSEDTIHFI